MVRTLTAAATAAILIAASPSATAEVEPTIAEPTSADPLTVRAVSLVEQSRERAARAFLVEVEQSYRLVWLIETWKAEQAAQLAAVAAAVRATEDAEVEQTARESEQSATTTRETSSTPAPADAGIWSQLAECESGGNWQINTGNGYYGGLQFSASTWDAMETGYDRADQAPPSVQIDAAQRLQAEAGWGQWPTCSRKLGLR
jgi:resuscitation-promoting factor RpfB